MTQTQTQESFFIFERESYVVHQARQVKKYLEIGLHESLLPLVQSFACVALSPKFHRIALHFHPNHIFVKFRCTIFLLTIF